MEKAVLSLATAAVSPILNKLGEKASSFFGGDITPEELQDLETVILPKIRAVIRVADTISSDELRPWVTKLKAAAYEAEDVLDEYEYENINSKVSNLPAPLKKIKGKAKHFLAPALLKTELKQSLEKLRQSADKADKLIPLLNLIAQTTTQQEATSQLQQQQQQTTVSGLSAPVFGRDTERDFIINKLVGEPVEPCSSKIKMGVPVYAICGIGGAGKTTLAQYIYTDTRVETHFDLKIWVHVDRHFDVHRITKEIIESAAESESSPAGNLNELQKKLVENLKSNKFLLVLDDVWCSDRQPWDQLLIPLNEVEEVGSRILITTRNKGLAITLGVKNGNIIPTNELNVDVCRSILKHYVFDDANKVIEDSELLNIGENILCKLNNSPLAARIVGCLLRNKVSVDAWKHVLNEDMLGGTRDALSLSFQYLAPHLQRCFAICSLYPKGWNFDSKGIAELTRLWIAQGFVEAPQSNELTLEDKGLQYFNDLVSGSFFQSHPTEQDIYVIHNLLHELAEKVSQNHCFRIEDDGPASIPATTLHLSIDSRKLAVHMPDILKLVNLRTFIFFDLSSSEFNDIIKDIKEMFKKLTKLRVLQFGRNPLVKLSSSVSQLKHLRYLQLRGAKKLPESFGRLYNLQFLDLGYNHIDRVSKSLNNLVNLRCLLAGDLLAVYDANRSKQYGLGQLKNLQQLGGSLAIEGLDNIKNKEGAARAMLHKKKHLKNLKLQWHSTTNVHGRTCDDEAVLEGLEPPPNLKVLHIDGYEGAKPPCWMLSNQDWLSNLQSLKLWNCPNLSMIPHLPRLLKNMEVESCPKLMQLSPFPYSLMELDVGNCPGIDALLFSAISYDGVKKEQQRYRQDKGISSHRSFILRELGIYNCSILDENILNLSLEQFASLSKLSFVQLPTITSLLLQGPSLAALKELIIYCLENLTSLKGIGSLPFLQRLYIDDCPRLSLMLQLPDADANADSDGGLTSMENSPAFTSLERLSVFKCPMLTAPGWGGGEVAGWLPSFEGDLLIDEPWLLPVLLQKRGLNSLVKLEIKQCSQDIPFTSHQEGIFLCLTSLKELAFYHCQNLPFLPVNLEMLSSLERLIICECPKVKLLPNLPSSLGSLYITYCPHLTVEYGAGCKLRHKINHIPDIRIF